MARGWESKSVESQIEDAGAAANRGEALTAEERRLRQKLQGLELSRKRVLHELAETRSAARRPALEAALAHLEAEIVQLTPSSPPASPVGGDPS